MFGGSAVTSVPHHILRTDSDQTTVTLTPSVDTSADDQLTTKT